MVVIVFVKAPKTLSGAEFRLDRTAVLLTNKKSVECGGGVENVGQRYWETVQFSAFL
jgi:hypothetical protein